MTLVLVALSYFTGAAVATYPVIRSVGSAIPGDLTDPLEHLWLMRWSKTCLLEGRSPFFCPDLHAPKGVPLGYFPTLHVQTLAYLAISPILENDVACFNAIWFAGLVATGLGTFGLCWWVVRDFWPAWLAGLGVMLCGPLMMHAHGHLETMQVGAVPLFLIAWISFIDQPGRGRLLAAVGLYLLMVACAPYFAVLGIFPAAWYLVWSTSQASGNRWNWLKGRLAWLIGFGALALPALVVLFANQVWAATHGYSMARGRAEFDQFGAPVWSSFAPSPLHGLARVAKLDLFALTGTTNRMIECSSYLGVVALLALAYAAIRRVRFPRRGYWWSLLGLMVVLSWGSSLDLAGLRIKLPGGWIYGIFPPFHLIRVPARFNLFAAVAAAVPVSAALADLLGRLRRPAIRGLAVIAFAGVILADLAMVPFATSTIPPMPDAYKTLTDRHPGETILDAPMFDAGHGQIFSSLWAYWQSIHGGRTSAGYPGLPNVAYDSEIVRGSSFEAGRLPGDCFGPVVGVDPRDYAWLFLTVHHYNHLMIHQGTFTDARYEPANARWKTLLAEANLYEDADVAVFSRDFLHAPEHLTWLAVSGFRPVLLKSDQQPYALLREARVAIYQPRPGQALVLELVDVSAFLHPRVVRLLDGDRELARWNITTGTARHFESPPFTLDSGIHELTLVADGDDPPTRSADKLDEARTPYTLRLGSVRVQPQETDR